MDSTKDKTEQIKDTPQQAPQQNRQKPKDDDKEKLLADAVKMLGEVSAGEGLKAFAEALLDAVRRKEQQEKQGKEQEKDQEQSINAPEPIVETIDLMDFMKEQQVKMNREELDAWELELAELSKTTAQEEWPLQPDELKQAREAFESGNKMAVYEMLAENKLSTQVLPEIETVRLFTFAGKELENTEELNKSYEAFKNGELDAVDKYLGTHAPELALAFDISKANGTHIINTNIVNEDQRKADLQIASDKFSNSIGADGDRKKNIESEVTGIEKNLQNPKEIAQVLRQGNETYNKIYNMVGKENGEDSIEIEKTLKGKLSPTNIMDLKKARKNPDDQKGKATVLSVANDAVKRDTTKKIKEIKAKQGIKPAPKRNAHKL